MSPFEKAEIQYQRQAYRNALELFLYAAEKDSANTAILERIAECQFRLGQIAEAEHSYAELSKAPGTDPSYKYQYAQVLTCLGKYNLARQWYDQFLQEVPDNTAAKEKRDFLSQVSDYYSDSLLYEITDESFNSDQEDFGPRFFKSGLVFTSARDHDLFIQRRPTSALNDHENMLNMYYVPLDTSQALAVSFPGKNLNSTFHDGPASFFDNSKGIVYTRTNMSDGRLIKDSQGRANLQLYIGRVAEDGAISHIQEFPYNSKDYSIADPWISQDGETLLFASDMPGGYGGSDIYESQLFDGKWSTPTNLGDVINTSGNDGFPSMLNDSTLAFASNGHGGLGGLDVYLSIVHEGQFEKAYNPGYPLNTSMDDFGMIADSTGRGGYFSSNRDGGLGYDDIYRYRVENFHLVGRVVDRLDSARSIEGAEVTVTSQSGNTKTTTSDKNGYFHFNLPFDENFHFDSYHAGYTWIDTLAYSTHERAIGSDTILMALWKHDLIVSGTIYSNEAQKAMANVTVTLQDFGDSTKQELTTDSTGRYTFHIFPGKHYRISAKRPDFIEEGYNLNTKGIYKGNLVNDIVLEEVFLEKGLVQFDFDKYDLKPEYTDQLDQLVRTLKKHPTQTLSIAAFADSRGTKEYNQILSDKRAVAVRNYFLAHGITSKRIEAVGFGEQLLLNRCSDGVECTEEEHSKNRRAELKVQSKPIN